MSHLSGRVPRVLGWAVLALSAIVLDAQESKSPAAEFTTRRETLLKKAADEHYKLGKIFFDKRMFEISHREFTRTIRLRPDHKDARIRLGYKQQTDGAWARDPKAKPEKENKPATYQLEEELKLTYEGKRVEMRKKVANDWSALGGFAEKNGLAAEATAAWRFAIRYNPDHSEARKKLGYLLEREVWVTAEESAQFKQLRSDVEKAPGGDEVKEETEVEKTLGIKLAKRATGRFRIQTVDGADRGARRLKLAEVARAEFLKLLEIPDDPPLVADRLEIIQLETQKQHLEYVEKLSPNEDKSLARQAGGDVSYQPPVTEGFKAAGNDPEESVIHDVIHIYLVHRGGTGAVIPWLYEGMSYTFTRRIMQQATVF
ncbi:MAG: hypothetical protein HYY93_14685 [Planctomycetes bacterium]|nr:hypothetical protein [Planctomycetota bacterium]